MTVMVMELMVSRAQGSNYRRQRCHRCCPRSAVRHTSFFTTAATHGLASEAEEVVAVAQPDDGGAIPPPPPPRFAPAAVVRSSAAQVGAAGVVDPSQ